jgi:hypothetical protein
MKCSLPDIKGLEEPTLAQNKNFSAETNKNEEGPYPESQCHSPSNQLMETEIPLWEFLSRVLAWRASPFSWLVQLYVYHPEMKGKLGEN